MDNRWTDIVKRYRLRNGLSQQQMAIFMQVSQRTISRWECGVDNPGLSHQKRLRDLGLTPPDALLRGFTSAVKHCPTPRFLTQSSGLRLIAVSKPALKVRPSIVDWIGRDLASIATAVLEEMLDDTELQRAILNKEVTGVTATSKTLLKSGDDTCTGTCRIVMSYFFHEGRLFNDTITYPVSSDEVCGYIPYRSDEL